MSAMIRLLRRLVLAASVCAALFIPADVSAQEVHFYHLDAIGNVRAVTDASGNVVERHDYLPFGEECTTGPCASNAGITGGQPKHFAGKERDTETGLDYFGARYYRGNLGRFTSVDPGMNTWLGLLDPQRWNRYSHSRNNPFRYVDPDGRELRTTARETVDAIAGPAGSRVVIRDGKVDTSALTPDDLSSNEGAVLLNDLSSSSSVYTYDEKSNPRGISNLDNRPDWRYGRGKGPGDLPPAGVDDAITIDPNARYVDEATGKKHVSREATAFHEMAEAYAKVDKNEPYIQKGGGPGAHEDARQREKTLLGQRPDCTEFPAGGQLKREQ